MWVGEWTTCSTCTPNHCYSLENIFRFFVCWVVLLCTVLRAHQTSQPHETWTLLGTILSYAVHWRKILYLTDHHRISLVELGGQYATTEPTFPMNELNCKLQRIKWKWMWKKTLATSCEKLLKGEQKETWAEYHHCTISFGSLQANVLL